MTMNVAKVFKGWAVVLIFGSVGTFANAQFLTVEDACRLANFQDSNNQGKCVELNSYHATRACTNIGLKGDNVLLRCIESSNGDPRAGNKIQLCAQFNYNQKQLLDCAVTCASQPLGWDDFVSCLQTR